ncbi:MAG: hypothetical protein QF450_06165 [Rhodospirillales bacterium]|nr:hypothetical protein [Rhodospirillales bacterium]HJO72369.1 hypothetical protein [Rhodospirillales bacterium]
MPSLKSAHLLADLVIAAGGRAAGAQIVKQLVEKLVESRRRMGGGRAGQPKEEDLGGEVTHGGTPGLSI